MIGYWKYTRRRWLPILLWSLPMLACVLVTDYSFSIFGLVLILYIALAQKRTMKQIDKIKKSTDCTLAIDDKDIVGFYLLLRGLKVITIFSLVETIVAFLSDTIEISTVKFAIFIPSFIIIFLLGTYGSWQKYQSINSKRGK